MPAQYNPNIIFSSFAYMDRITSWQNPGNWIELNTGSDDLHLTTNNNLSMDINGSSMYFGDSGLFMGLTNECWLDFANQEGGMRWAGGAASEIYDNGDLVLWTDDNLRLKPENEVNIGDSNLAFASDGTIFLEDYNNCNATEGALAFDYLNHNLVYYNGSGWVNL